MDTFKIGDKVEVLDEAIKGNVVGVTESSVTIETLDGFEMEYEASQVVKIEGVFQVTNYDVAKAKQSKELPKKRKSSIVKPKERNTPKMEVDLHIHQLTNSTKGMNNFDVSVSRRLCLFTE